MERELDALKFNEELLKLCKKYNCMLEAGTYADSNVMLNMLTNNGDSFDYELDTDLQPQYLTSCSNNLYVKNELIKNMLVTGNPNRLSIYFTHDIIVVITDDIRITEKKFKEIKAQFSDEQISCFNTISLELKDGTEYKWIKPSEYDVREGYKFNKAMIDDNINMNYMGAICYHSHIQSKDNIFIF